MTESILDLVLIPSISRPNSKIHKKKSVVTFKYPATYLLELVVKGW